MRQPALPQGLEAAPAVVRAQRDGEAVAQLPVEVGQVALRVIERPHAHAGEFGQALGQQAQCDALAGARIAVDPGKSPSRIWAFSMRQQKFSSFGGTKIASVGNSGE